MYLTSRTAYPSSLERLLSCLSGCGVLFQEAWHMQSRVEGDAVDHVKRWSCNVEQLSNVFTSGSAHTVAFLVLGRCQVRCSSGGGDHRMLSLYRLLLLPYADACMHLWESLAHRLGTVRD